MNSVERVKMLCKERRIPISKLEKDLGYSNGYIGQLRKGTFPADRLKKISEYLDVSIEYLMTGKEPPVDYVVRTDDGDELLVETYYLNEETAQTAQEIFENDKVLFDVYRSTDKDRLIAYAKKLKALQDQEKGEE